MRKITMRFRLFCTFIAIFLTPLILLGAIGIWWASETVMKNAVSSYQATLKNVAQRLDEDLSSLSDVVTLFNKDPMITRLTYMQGDQVDYSRISAADLQSYKNELLFHCGNSRLYSDVAICFPSKNVVVSTLGLWNLDWFFEDEFSVEGLSLDNWHELLTKNTILPNTTIRSFGYEKRGLICLRTGAASMTGKVLMSVIFWINNSTLDSYLNDLALFPGTVAGLQDGSGQWIHTYAKEIPEQTQLEMLADGSLGGTYTSSEGKRYTLLAYTSTGLGWRYSVLLPQEDIYAGTRSIRGMIYLILGVMSVVGCALSLELTALNYRPMERIFHLLSAHFKTGANPTNREMEEIETRLSGMISEQALLRERITASRPMLQYAVLSHLVEGDASVAGPDMLSMLNLSFNYPLFGVAVLCGWQGGQWPNSAVLCAYPFKKRDQQMALLNFSQQEDVEEWAQPILEHIQAIFLSAPHKEITDLPKAFEEAMHLKQTQALEQNVRLYWYEPTPQGGGAVFYPRETERELMDALTAGNSEKALSIWETLLTRNKDSLAFGKLIVAMELTLNKTDDASGGLAQQLQAFPPLVSQSLQEQLKYMRGLLTKAAGYHREQMETRQAAFLNQLLCYIDQHISNEQLTLSAAATELNVSTTYLSRYFKEHMHIGYLDYVNRKRIELAKQLLSEEKYTVKDIALRVGFGNDATFRRVFKKYEGTTPSHL